MSQQFCLKWNNHLNNMMDVFKNLLSTESMVDVTLACDGLSLKAHKIVLSACSPFFQSLFLENPCKHPIVILKDMKYTELKAIIEFMYHGEVNVAQEQLSALMKTAETLRVKGLAEMPNEKNSSSTQEEPSHRSVPRTETPPPKRRRGRVRKRSLSDSNRSDDSNDHKIKQPHSPDIEELSGDVTMDNTSGQFSNLQSQVPMQSLPSHSTPMNSYQKASSMVSQDPQIEEPASADESEFGVEPAKLLEQTLTTDDLQNRRSRTAMSSNIDMQRRPRSSTDHSSNLVPTSMSSDTSLSANQQPESPPDIKPELLELDPPMSPVAGPSHSTDNSMMMYMDQSSVSSHPGTSFQDNTALVPQDSQPQASVLVIENPNDFKCKKLYQCSLCNYSATRRTWVQIHLRLHTGEMPYTCEFCGRKFRWYTSAKVHLRKCHRVKCGERDLPSESNVTLKKVFKCNICGKEFLEEEACKWHSSFCSENLKTQKVLENLIDSADSWRCSFCDEEFDDDQLYLIHSASCSESFKVQKDSDIQNPSGETELFECEKCRRSFPNEGRLMLHRDMCQRYTETVDEFYNKVFHCSTCKRTFRNEIDCKNHISSKSEPSEIVSFSCIYCNKVYTKTRSWRRHTASCKKTFEAQRIVEKLLKSREKTFECRFCSKKFAKKSVYMNHSSFCNSFPETRLGVEELLRLGHINT